MIRFLFIFVFVLSSWGASVNNQFDCGFPVGGNTFTSQITGKTFHQIAPGDTGSSFAAYNCPKVPGSNYQNVTFKEITLVDINFETGEFICSYDKGDGSDPVRIKFNTNDDNGIPVCVEPIYDTDNYPYENNNIVTKEFIPAILPNNPSSNPVPYMSNLKNNDLAYELTDYMKQNNFGTVNILANNQNIIPIDSHSNYKQTASAVLAGIITLDPDYLGQTATGSTKYINGMGEIVLSPQVTTIQPPSGGSIVSQTYDTIKQGINFLKSKIFHIKSAPNTQGSAASLSPVDIFDTQVLGWYTYFVANLKNVYYMLIFKLFVLGGIYFTGGVVYKKMLAKYGKEEFQFNSISRVTSIILAILFFSAPFAEDVKSLSSSGGGDKMIYVDAAGNGNLDYYRYSTAAQELVRYTADYATFFGNYLNDTLLSTFLVFMKYKQGILSIDEVVGDIRDNYLTMQKNTNLLAVKYNFFDMVCKGFFGPFYKNKKTFLASQEELDNLWVNYSDKLPASASVLQNAGLDNVNRIDPYLCYKIENSIPTLMLMVANAGTRNLINAKKVALLIEQRKSTSMANATSGSTLSNLGLGTLQAALNAYNMLIASGSNQQQLAQNNFLKYYNLVSATNNYIGWLDSIIVPISYLVFKDSDIFIFNDILDEVRDKKGSRATDFGAQALLRAKQATENIRKDNQNYSSADAVIDLLNQDIEGFDPQGLNMFSIKQTILGWSAWLMVPVFKETFVAIRKTLLDMFQIKSNESSGKLNFILKGLAFLPGVSKLSSILGSLSDYALVVVFSVIAFIAAKIITEFVFSMATMIIASLMLIYKAFRYFIELLIYYVISPFLPIFAFQAGSNMKNFMSHYLKHLSVLLITPMIIVFSAYLFIFGFELVTSLYEGIVRFVTVSISLGLKLLAGSGFGTSTKLAMLYGIGELVKYILILFVAYVIIIGLANWIADKAGLEAKDMTDQTFGELQQRSRQYMNPLT